MIDRFLTGLSVLSLLLVLLIAACGGGEPDDDKTATIDPPNCAASGACQ